jgi:hypothetical protein
MTSVDNIGFRPKDGKLSYIWPKNMGSWWEEI